MFRSPWTRPDAATARDWRDLDVAIKICRLLLDRASFAAGVGERLAEAGRFSVSFSHELAPEG
jgi:hypothetical protein